MRFSNRCCSTALMLAVVLVVVGCGYHPVLLQKGGLNSIHIDEIENQTASAEVVAQLSQLLSSGFRAHGIKTSGETPEKNWRLAVQVSRIEGRVSSMSADSGTLGAVDTRWSIEGRMSVTSPEGKVVVFQEAINVSEMSAATGGLRDEEAAADRVRARLMEAFASRIVERVLEI